jgi:hypothetical protein
MGGQQLLERAVIAAARAASWTTIGRVMTPKVRFAADSALEEGVTSEPVSESPNSLLSGKIQGF